MIKMRGRVKRNNLIYDSQGLLDELQRALHEVDGSKCTLAVERINLLVKMRNMQHELNVMREHLDEEYEAKQEVERQLSKAFSNIQLWKTCYETEGVARAEESERDKSKIVGRLAEAEDTVQNEQNVYEQNEHMGGKGGRKKKRKK